MTISKLKFEDQFSKTGLQIKSIYWFFLQIQHFFFLSPKLEKCNENSSSIINSFRCFMCIFQYKISFHTFFFLKGGLLFKFTINLQKLNSIV